MPQCFSQPLILDYNLRIDNTNHSVVLLLPFIVEFEIEVPNTYNILCRTWTESLIKQHVRRLHLGYSHLYIDPIGLFYLASFTVMYMVSLLGTGRQQIGPRWVATGG